MVKKIIRIISIKVTHPDELDAVLIERCNLTFYSVKYFNKYESNLKNIYAEKFGCDKIEVHLITTENNNVNDIEDLK